MRDKIPRNMAKADLVDLVRERAGFSRIEARELVETVLRIIEDRLRAGEGVKISGFGRFTVHYKHSRRGRNPRTGLAIIIDPRRVLSFKASQGLKDLVAGTVPFNDEAAFETGARERHPVTTVLFSARNVVHGRGRRPI